MTVRTTEDSTRRALIAKRWGEALAKIDLNVENRVGDLIAIGYDDNKLTRSIARRQEFAYRLRRPDRTVRRWIDGDHATPREVELILDWLCAGKISIEDLR